METIHIVTASDDGYAKHLAVMLNSLLHHKASKNPIQIYVIDSDISEANKARLIKTVKNRKGSIQFLKINPKIYEVFKTKGYLTKETYYRISIPDLLGKDVKKVLYLDTDIIVKEDITPLWKVNIDHHFLGAVEDCWIKGRRNRFLSIPKDSKYFNAGVLLMNLKKWRKQKIANRIIQFIKTNPTKIKFCSQDPLNAILHDKWLPLDPKWNFQTHHLSLPEFKIKKPAIIHYTGPNKPWKAKHRLKKEYFKYVPSE